MSAADSSNLRQPILGGVPATTTPPNPALLDAPREIRKFLQFHIGSQDLAGLTVEAIAEIATVRLSEVLPVPQMRSCILGVYNWRGEMLWVVDLGELLGYPPLHGLSADTTQPRATSAVAVVVEWQDHIMGFVVPQVRDLVTYNLAHLQNADAQLFPPAVLPYLQGYFIEDNGDIAIVLDLAEIFRVLQHPQP